MADQGLTSFSIQKPTQNESISKKEYNHMNRENGRRGQFLALLELQSPLKDKTVT